jgi:hypothetical protein
MVATSFEKGLLRKRLNMRDSNIFQLPIEGRKYFGSLSQFKALATNKLG